MASDSWCDKHLYIYSDASRPQSPPVSRSDSPTLSSGKWLIVGCKHCECCWVYVGLPQCAHHEHILFWSWIETVWVRHESTPPPSPFIAIFCFTCFSITMWIQSASLLLFWTLTGKSKVKILKQSTHAQALCLPCSPNNYLLWWWHLQWTRGQERGQKRHNVRWDANKGKQSS